MRTPSPVPLDHFDTVARYAQRPVDELNDDKQATRDSSGDEAQRPPGIETDHDARILDEIEASLRALIIADHNEDDEDARLTDVSRMAAEQLADQQLDDQPAADETASEPQAAERQPEMPDTHSIAADISTVREAFRDPRTPPWLLARSLEPEAVPQPADEPWPPRKRAKRKRSNSLFLRFGLAATGAAVVAAVAVKDIPTLVLDYVRGPIEHLSTNAVSVFNEGKATSLQARIDGVQKEQDRTSEPSLRFAVATADSQARAIPVKTETIGRVSEPRKEVKETVMTPWPAPDAAKRNEPAHWQPPSVQTPAVSAAPSRAPSVDSTTRPLNGEEVAMLRKMGDDYIAAGDFVGARGVLERAADAGDSSAAFAIASTYDPVVLARFKVRGLEPDIVKASFWYERARELGSPEAPHRLQAMMASRTN
jgi:hypothetical protein